MSHPSLGLKTTDTNLSQQYFAQLKQAVLSVRPELAKILSQNGNVSLADYVRQYFLLPQPAVSPVLKEQLLTTFEHEVSLRLGVAVAADARKQLERYYFVSTADHYGPLMHPYFLNSNLVTGLVGTEFSDVSSVIVLSCANVSQNNSSFPRGILFTGLDVVGNAQLHRLPILPSSSRLAPVINFRSYQPDEIIKAKKEVAERVAAGQLHADIAQKVNAILDDVYNNPQAHSFSSFADQITYTNFLLWKRFFGSSSPHPTDLVYLPQETLVRSLLLDYHQTEQTIIHKILFNADVRAQFEHCFDGVEGGFSLTEQQGSYLFWALPAGSKYRQQLWRRGDELVSADGSYRLALTPDAVSAALRNNELIPGTLLCLLVLALYYGLTCLGGFCQVNYLTTMKESYVRFLDAVGNHAAAVDARSIVTTLLGEDFLVAFLGTSGDNFTLATGLDMLLYGSDELWRTLRQQAEHLTVAQAFDIMMPEFYRALYPQLLRRQELAVITDKQILCWLHASHKLEPFGHLMVRD